MDNNEEDVSPHVTDIAGMEHRITSLEIKIEFQQHQIDVLQSYLDKILDMMNVCK